MARLRLVACVALLVVTAPSLVFGQAAAALVRSMAVPDRVWIDRQCGSIRMQVFNDDAARQAQQMAMKACDAFAASPASSASRDAWVRAMLSLQNDVGPAAMRAFMPVMGGFLPEGLSSYSLFLIPDDRWRSPMYLPNRDALWRAFMTFGQSIGDDHAAVWFLDQEENIDVLRGQEYCDRFGLSYNDGPYVVTVRKRPDLLGQGDEIVVIRMNGIAPDRVQLVLNRLAQDLRRGRAPGTGALVYEELKQRMITLMANHPEGVQLVLKLIGLG